MWQEKSNLKFDIYLYFSRNFIVFVLNLVYLYIHFRSVTLFLKLSKFVIKSFLNIRKFLCMKPNIL